MAPYVVDYITIVLLLHRVIGTIAVPFDVKCSDSDMFMVNVMRCISRHFGVL